MLAVRDGQLVAEAERFHTSFGVCLDLLQRARDERALQLGMKELRRREAAKGSRRGKRRGPGS